MVRAWVAALSHASCGSDLTQALIDIHVHLDLTLSSHCDRHSRAIVGVRGAAAVSAHTRCRVVTASSCR